MLTIMASLATGHMLKLLKTMLLDFVDHDRCNILYLQKVAAVGIFSQEGEVEVVNNHVTKFKESITIMLADFHVENNNIDFSDFGIIANNSEGKLLSNSITNTSKALTSYLSSIDVEANIFRDFEKAVYSLNSTLNLVDNFFAEGDFCIDFIDSDYELITNDFDCREMDYQVRYNIRIHIADESGQGSEDHFFEIFNSDGEFIVDSLTYEEGLSNYFQVDIIQKKSDENIIDFNPLKIIFENNNVPVIVYKNISFNHTIDLLIFA